MRKTLLILGVLALTAVPLFGQWQGDFRITNTTENSYPSYYGGRCIAADDANVHIAWREVINRKFYVRYFTFPIGSPIETSWGEELSPLDGGDAAVAVHDGTVDVTWFYKYGSPLLFTREKNGSWGSIIEHGTASYSAWPGIAFDSNGDLHCAFGHISFSGADAGYSIYHQRKNSGASSYSSPVLAFVGGWRFVDLPSICITSDNAIHISVAHRAGYSVKHIWSTDGGATWNNEAIGTDIVRYIHKTSICRDSDDNLFIAYVGLGSRYPTYVATNASGSWVSTQVSQTIGDRTWHPSICCDIYDNVWVAWGDGSFGSAYEIHYNKYDAESGSWEGDSILSSDDGFVSRYCKIAADEKGNVHVCWQDLRDGNFEVYYNWFLGDTTPPPPPGRDLAVVRILQPVDSIGKEPVTPRAVIANLGSDVDSGYARCVITGPGSNYDKGDIEGIVYLEVGEEDAVEFPSWTPPGDSGDRYRVEVTVYLWPEKTTEDDDPTNNTKVEYATINKPNDPDPPPGVIEEVDALRIEVTAFRSGSLVSYVMPYPTETTIRVYDVTGKVVYTLHDGELSGSGSLYWDGTDDAGVKLAGGLYFIRIAASDFTKTAKVVLLH